MEDILANEFLWVTILAGGVIGIAVVVKVPELMLALLMVGQDFIQFSLTLVKLRVTRRQFAAAGAVIFIPVVLLFLVMRMVQGRERDPIIGRPNLRFIGVAITVGVLLLIGLTYTDANYTCGPRKTTEYFVFGLAPMFLGFIFLRDRASSQRLLVWIVLIAAAMIGLVSAFTLAKGGSLSGVMIFLSDYKPEKWGGMEVSGHGSLSGAVVIMTGALLGLAAARTRGLWKVLPILALPVASYFIMHAGTRSNLVAFVGVALLGFFLAYKGKRWMFGVALVMFLIVGGLLLAFASPEVQERMLSSWWEAGTTHGYGGRQRLDILQKIPGQFAQAPILGHGTGGWTILEHNRDYYVYPHNMFAEILVENGIIGLAGLLALWWIVGRRVWHHLKTAEPGTDLYGLAVFGACLLIYELCIGLAHFGLAHHSCTLLLSSAIILRSTFLAAEDSPRLAWEEETGEMMSLHASLQMRP